jgi:RNA polymerase sigma-70 factor (ECF subfamily)
MATRNKKRAGERKGNRFSQLNKSTRFTLDNDINRVVKEYGSYILNISYRMIEDREVAKEAAQEAWIEIMTSLPNFRGESQLSTWIYTITSRTIFRYMKNERRYSVTFIRKFLNGPEIEYPDDAQLEKRQWVREMCDKCITGSLHCLSNEERLVYLLYDVAGMKSNELETILSISGESIRQKMSRNRKKLHSFLNDQCILYNPNGNCRCRMVRNVEEMNIQSEFTAVQNDIHDISFLLQCKKILSPDDDLLINICHRYTSLSTH